MAITTRLISSGSGGVKNAAQGNQFINVVPTSSRQIPVTNIKSAKKRGK